MNSIINHPIFNLDDLKHDKKLVYTFKTALIIGLSSILLFVALVIYYRFNPQFSIGIGEIRILFIPLVSVISILLLQYKKTGLAKLFLSFGSLFFFSYFVIFWGNITEETVLLNSSIIITLSAFAQFTFDYEKEKYYYHFTIITFFVLIIFSNEIFSHFNPNISIKQLTKDDFFVVRLAYIIIFTIKS